MIVQRYEFDGVRMAVDLLGEGKVALYFEGTCTHDCGQGPHSHTIDAEIHCLPSMTDATMNQVEGAIRGQIEVAGELCRETVAQLLAASVGTTCD